MIEIAFDSFDAVDSEGKWFVSRIGGDELDERNIIEFSVENGDGSETEAWVDRNSFESEFESEVEVNDVFVVERVSEWISESKEGVVCLEYDEELSEEAKSEVAEIIESFEEETIPVDEADEV